MGAAHTVSRDTLRMCDSCKGILPNDEKHSEDVCPIAMALTCSCCGKRGHSTLKCEELDYWCTRVPEYVEQLIPYELRLHYQIPAKQCTSLIPNSKPIPCVIPVISKDKDGLHVTSKAHIPVIEIPADKEKEKEKDKDITEHKCGIRAFMASNNLPTGSVKDNKRILEAVASKVGKKVIYLKKPTANQDGCEGHAGKAKKQAIFVKG